MIIGSNLRHGINLNITASSRKQQASANQWMWLAPISLSATTTSILFNSCISLQIYFVVRAQQLWKQKTLLTKRSGPALELAMQVSLKLSNQMHQTLEGSSFSMTHSVYSLFVKIANQLDNCDGGFWNVEATISFHIGHHAFIGFIYLQLTFLFPKAEESVFHPDLNHYIHSSIG